MLFQGIKYFILSIKVCGIAEKSLEIRRDRWGGNLNPKSLF